MLNGDVLSMTDSVMGTWSYTYDDFNRLVSGNATAGVDSGLTLGWTYDRGPRRQVLVDGVEDRYGNRWAQNATGSGNASAVQPQLSFTGNNNHIDGWTYDAAGNLLNDGRNNYAYDAEGRIVTLNGAPTYLYDAEDRRVAKYSDGVISASHLLDLAGNQVTELNTSGQWVHSNVFAGGGRLIATYEGTAGPHPNTWHFHLTDWLGTQRMQTNVAGNQEEVCYSYPFGDGLTCTGTTADATEHHFVGKERDAESGNDYFGARYYEPSTGRFLSPDWAAAPTAVPYATFGDPQTLNLYDYVNNTPNTGIDLDGHDGVQTPRPGYQPPIGMPEDTFAYGEASPPSPPMRDDGFRYGPDGTGCTYQAEQQTTTTVVVHAYKWWQIGKKLKAWWDEGSQLHREFKEMSAWKKLAQADKETLDNWDPASEYSPTGESLDLVTARYHYEFAVTAQGLSRIAKDMVHDTDSFGLPESRLGEMAVDEMREISSGFADGPISENVREAEQEYVDALARDNPSRP